MNKIKKITIYQIISSVIYASSASLLAAETPLSEIARTTVSEGNQQRIQSTLQELQDKYSKSCPTEGVNYCTDLQEAIQLLQQSVI